MRRLYVGPPGTTVAGSRESHHYYGNDWRAGGLAGRRYKCTLKFNWRGAGPPGTIVAGSAESHHYHGNDWRAGGLAGRRYKCDVE